MDDTGFIVHWPGGAEATNSDAFDEDVLECAVPALVELWAARCRACLRLAPQLEQLAREQEGRLRVFTVNVDEELPVAVRFQVLAIPALLLFVGGQEVARWAGGVDMAAVRSQLRTLSQSAASPL
jgi:thioredoxin-like negative regulator of GroEL